MAGSLFLFATHHQRAGATQSPLPSCLPLEAEGGACRVALGNGEERRKEGGGMGRTRALHMCEALGLAPRITEKKRRLRVIFTKQLREPIPW